LAPWLGTENIIRGKVVASPKSELWWILWVRVCPWLIRAPKVLRLYTNKFVVWFVQVCVSNWLACHSSQSLSQSFSTLLYPQSATSQGAYPNSSLFHCVHLEFTLMFIKELGNASLEIWYFRPSYLFFNYY
jgi:hypothetical protein